MKPDLTIVPARPEVEIHKRKPLNRKQAVALALLQEGKCGCGKCGQDLDPLGEGFIDEHWTALDFGGSNELQNRALLRVPCAKAKTVGDNRMSKKINRILGELKPKRSRPINSRGFDKSVSRRFGGTVRRMA